MSRPRTTHKVQVERKHMKPHFDWDCHCFSFQEHCPACSLKRAVSESGQKIVIDEIDFEGILFFIDGKRYMPTDLVEEFIQDFFKPVWNHYPREAVLLFKDDQTVDLRYYQN